DGFIGYAGIKIGAVSCPCVIILQDSNNTLYKVLVKRLPQPPPSHPVNEEGDPPTGNDEGWTKREKDGTYVNASCFDRETNFQWCVGIIPSRIFEETTQRSVYHVNTSQPMVPKPAIRFEKGDIDADLSQDRQSLTVKWPKAITQPSGLEVSYLLIL